MGCCLIQPNNSKKKATIRQISGHNITNVPNQEEWDTQLNALWRFEVRCSFNCKLPFCLGQPNVISSSTVSATKNLPANKTKEPHQYFSCHLNSSNKRWWRIFTSLETGKQCPPFQWATTQEPPLAGHHPHIFGYKWNLMLVYLAQQEAAEDNRINPKVPKTTTRRTAP